MPSSPAAAPSRPAAGGTEQLRRGNLSAALEVLHHHGPLRRAALTKRLGLNRSTIASVVGELQELGLAYESSPQSTGEGGRPSGVVGPSSDVVAIAEAAREDRPSGDGAATRRSCPESSGLDTSSGGGRTWVEAVRPGPAGL